MNHRDTETQINLINFGVPVLKQGIKRVASGGLFKEEAAGRSFAFRLLSYLCAPCLCG